MLQLRQLLKRYFSQAAPGISGAVALVAVLAGNVPAQASVPLRRADIEQILNRVELIPRGRSARTARVSDFLSIGDALRTAAASRAELRFNDGSLGRVGQRATFHFIPNTRNFRLSNGTMLLLIPPGRGRSTIQTPSAVTGIQGSALVVRHLESRDLTMVMALTNNPAGAMTVTLTNCDAGTDCSREYGLRAGEMALIQQGQVEVLAFDLLQFYETSSIIEGLELTNPDSTLDLGPGINQVREEIQDALEQYQPFDDGQSHLLNPAVISVTSTAESVADQPWLLSPDPSSMNSITARSTIPVPAGVLTELGPSENSDVSRSPSDTPAVEAGQEPAPQVPPVVDLPGRDSPDPTDEVDAPDPPTADPAPTPTPETPEVEPPDPSPEQPSMVEPPDPAPEQPSMVEPPDPAPEPPVIEPPDPAPEQPSVVEPPDPFPESPVVEPPDPAPEPPVIELPNPAPESPVVEPPDPVPQPPMGEGQGPGSGGPGQAEPPPFNGFPGQDLPNPSLEDGPGRADPPPFRDD